MKNRKPKYQIYAKVTVQNNIKMSCSYADALSPYENKGKCGLPESFDDEEAVSASVRQLADWIKVSKRVVVHTGAGISTSAGIPDFRGPKGVWTLEQKGEKPNINISFNDAKPTLTHMALVELYNRGLIHYIVSQNVDGLHLKSGFPRHSLSELHGNMFVEQCSLCERQFVRSSAAPTVGQKFLSKNCPWKKPGGRACRGKLRDNILDWEAELPYSDLELANKYSREADLSLCLGSTLQIVPSGNLPLLTKQNKGKFIVCNLQPTKHDKQADLIIHSYVDNVLSLLCKFLDISIPEYNPVYDPTTKVSKLESEGEDYVEWTLQLPKNFQSSNKTNGSVRSRKRKFKEANEEIEEKPLEMIKGEIQGNFVKEEQCY